MQPVPFQRDRFPPDVIRLAVWLYFRFTLSFRDWNSHLVIRRRERKQQRFKSQRSAQRFLATHAAVHNNFNVQRHLIRRSTLRLLRAEADRTWATATAAA